ncbi:PEP-CTERM sorting domain-containing protein [Mastigocladopsis repens]|uniref:PEP-CTERM sorting domain-containing protein n=1 Tax=Mastigocladopsis repens TaxID=221287 RepID=UPI000313859E|nr:PEP-CTERM sorting domain-containing protein [Mastigocladopsis repens]
MALLNKLSLAAVTSAVAFLTLGTFATDPAQAALFKYSFEGDGASGYFIYDDSTEGTEDSPTSTVYYDAVQEYKIDLGDEGVFQGTTANAIVFLVRQGNGITAPETDDFLLEVRASQRDSEYALLSYFSYPTGTFEESRDLPTSVPTTATVSIYPNADFPNSIGETAFTGTVTTRIEKIPEPASVSALLGVGVGTCFILRRRQRRQTLSV